MLVCMRATPAHADTQFFAQVQAHAGACVDAHAPTHVPAHA